MLDERVNRIAALANVAGYDQEGTRRYIDGAPHIKHASLRRLYGQLVTEVFDRARAQSAEPRVLDLGAGEGSVTLPFLELGAHVTAVDISESQLEVLRKRCRSFGDRLVTRCENINDTVLNIDDQFDVIVTNSLLHHIPDYVSLIRNAVRHLRPRGQFFSFQDPLRYDSLSRYENAFRKVAYYAWRLRQGDVVSGFGRVLRRKRGVYLDDSVNDNVEYHMVRNGVDQDAISAFFEGAGFDCRIVRYFSTQSSGFQLLGARIGGENTFAVVAQARA